MKFTNLFWGFLFFAIAATHTNAAMPALSDASRECIECHTSVHPGIVAAWQQSRHAKHALSEDLKQPDIKRSVSGTHIPDNLKKYAVGCAECHLARPKEHDGTFEHNGFRVHTVVSPDDCAICHATEAKQYHQNIMSHARGNLANNAIYQQLQSAILDTPTLTERDELLFQPSTASTQAEACYHCHGTQIAAKGLKMRDTIMGAMKFPVLSGWPNQGVGRINTDNSKGSCTACHTRHTFSIAMARKPYTCKQCHVGPDVPASKVYEASKHGNIYLTMHAKWNFKAIPWSIGRDFTAPTCAVCHMSLLVNGDGEVVAKRTHQMSDRLPYRLYGLIYAHDHPEKPDTTIIRNKEGLPLPTSFDGQPATDFLISEKQKAVRLDNMQSICQSCHSSGWTTNHFDRLKNTIQSTNHQVKAATDLMTRIWQQGLAQRLPQPANPFDEAVEKKWVETWLFQANSIRFAAAMAGGGDYGVFAGGRFQLLNNIADIKDWLENRRQ
jgi:hydroxylamine dehydrogenase